MYASLTGKTHALPHGAAHTFSNLKAAIFGFRPQLHNYSSCFVPNDQSLGRDGSFWYEQI
jgi:hypothetical protein